MIKPTQLLAAAALVAALPLAAAPIQLNSTSLHGDEQLNGYFVHQFAPFELTQTSSLRFSLTGFTESGEASDLEIFQVTLSNGLQQFDFLGSSLVHVGDRCLNLDEQACQPEDFQNWYRDYQLADVTLGAGAWTVTVQGEDADNKLWSEYNLQARAQAVPEPWSLMLALGALVPALSLRRRAR